MQVTINSKNLSRPVTFSRPGSSYVYWDINGQSGTLGKQPTTNGHTLTYDGESQSEFERVCRRWFRRYLKDLKLFMEYN